MLLVLCNFTERSLITNRLVCSTLQVLRWKKRSQTHPTKATLYRKPRWMPTAKSKVYKIPQHPYVDPEEKAFVDELVLEYYRYMESLKRLFKIELDKKSDTSILALELAKTEEEQHQQLMEENRQENERIRLIREEIREKQFQEKAFRILQEYEEDQKVEAARKAEIESIVRQEKELCKNYITYETIDSTIEAAIDSPINKNFCIDTKANIYWEDIPPKDYENYVYSCLVKHKSLPAS